MTGQGGHTAVAQGRAGPEHAAAPARLATDVAGSAPVHGVLGTIHSLQRSAGNHATSALIQRLSTAAESGPSGPASAPGMSRALRHEGQPLDATTRSAFESTFARTRVTPRSAAMIERHPTGGRFLASPASTAEREADHVSGQVLPGGHPRTAEGQPGTTGGPPPDFSRVRIHADAAAARTAYLLGANAFTVGSHIFFGAGQLDLSSPKGRRLLAHELTHVLQGPQQESGAPQVNDHTVVYRQSWTEGVSKWYEDKKWAVYRAMIAGFKKGKNATVAFLRGQIRKAPESLQSALGIVLDVYDFFLDMVFALLLAIIGLAVGFVEGIVGLITGIVKLAIGLGKLLVDWMAAVLGKPDAYMEDVNALVAAIKGIPDGIKKIVGDWIERYKKASLEEQVLMGGELVGQIEAFIATFALAGTKAGQATSFTVRVPLKGLQAGQEAAALGGAKAVTVTIPAVVPKTAAEAAVITSQMMATSGGGTGGGDGGKEATEAPKAEEENGPYKDIKDDTLVEPGRKFTSPQKRKIIKANRERNGGRLRSDDPLDPYQDLSDPVRSVSPGLGGEPQDPAMAAVDHVVPRAAGGSNSYGNARVISQYYNNLLRAKGAKAGAVVE